MLTKIKSIILVTTVLFAFFDFNAPLAAHDKESARIWLDEADADNDFMNFYKAMQEAIQKKRKK